MSESHETVKEISVYDRGADDKDDVEIVIVLKV